jgi:hypothetical protein
MSEREIKPGEWFAKIVKLEGLGTEWKKIYNGGDNADFRKACPDPDLLIPGEKCVLPEKKKKEESKPGNAKASFKLKGDKAQLNVVVIRPDGQPLKSVDYKLTLHGSGADGTVIAKKTDGSGAVKCDIPVDTDSATLDIEGQELELKIGWLEPVETVKGVQARLRNLNYAIADVDGNAGPETPTAAAVAAFQKEHSLSDPEGEIGPQMQKKLKDIHGC